MTTPTPNELDRKLAERIVRKFDEASRVVGGPRLLFQEAIDEQAVIIASHRAEIEARADCALSNAKMETASAIEQRDVNRVKLTKALAALDKADKTVERLLVETSPEALAIEKKNLEEDPECLTDRERMDGQDVINCIDTLTAIREAKDQSK